MSELDHDLQARLRALAEAVGQPEREQTVIRKARIKRRLVAAATALSGVAAVAGIAGASMRWVQDAAPAPGSEQICGERPYDIAVHVSAAMTRDEVRQLGERLRLDERVESVAFITRQQAQEEYLDKQSRSRQQPLPSVADTAAYRVSLRPGIQPTHRLMREFANLGDGVSTPVAPRCPGDRATPSTTFARYFFDVAEGDASAAGILEVNWTQKSLCLEVQTRNIEASHLLIKELGERDLPERVIFTFFQPGGREAGEELSPTGTHCFSSEQLGDFEKDFHRLFDEPERFTLDFHRGPNDEFGLTAELVPQGTEDDCAAGPRITAMPGGRVVPGDRVGIAGECFQRHRLHKRVTVFLTAQLGSEGRPLTKQQVAAGKRGCQLFADTRSEITISADGRMRGWFVVPADGTCTKRFAARTHVGMGSGTYGVAIGCRACVYTTIRVKRSRVPVSFHSVEDAVAYLSQLLDMPLRLPSKLPRGVRLDPVRPVRVNRHGGVTTATMTLRFGKQGIMGFTFGSARFDGCGGDGAVEVDLKGQPALMLAKDELPWTQIIWPASEEDLEGAYGIYGSLPSTEMLELARSVPRLKAAQTRQGGGCL